MVLVLLGKNPSRGTTRIIIGTTSLSHIYKRLTSLLFLIYINDLPHHISSVCKMFTNDTSLFWKVKVKGSNLSLSLSDTNYDLETINQWAHHGLLENSELCRMDNLIEQSQNNNSWLIKSTSILDKEVY